jgi:hypothetical protein
VQLGIRQARYFGRLKTLFQVLLAQLPQVEVEKDFPRVFSGSPSGWSELARKLSVGQKVM